MHSKRALLLAAVAIVGVCCGGGSGGSSPTTPSNPTSQGLPGTWRATKSEFVSAANSSVRVDIVAQGSTVTLVLDAAAFTLTIKDPGQIGNVTTGSYRTSTDTMTMTPANMPFSWQFDMNLSGNTLTLTGGSVEFDFNADGSMDQAKLNLTLTRQ